MNLVLWALQGILAAAFGLFGTQKLVTPWEELAASQAWANAFSPGMVVAIGVAEVLGTLGVILPAATRIVPVLTPIAAVGLGLTMIGAGITNVTQDDPGGLVLNIPLLAIAAVVAWGRFGPFAITGGRPAS